MTRSFFLRTFVWIHKNNPSSADCKKEVESDGTLVMHSFLQGRGWQYGTSVWNPYLDSYRVYIQEREVSGAARGIQVGKARGEAKLLKVMLANGNTIRVCLLHGVPIYVAMVLC
jgi:hypothetical protein